MEKDAPKCRRFRAVARRPNPIAKRMNTFIINGYYFHTQHRDKGKKLIILVLWWKLKEKLIMKKSMTSLS